MSKRIQDVAPDRPAENKAWLKENIAEQKKRHKAIMKEMNVDLAKTRAKWYKSFLKDISTTGFNVTGDMKRVIKKNELPKPRKQDKVVD
jgi:L-rhamnose mutarotase